VDEDEVLAARIGRGGALGTPTPIAAAAAVAAVALTMLRG